MTTLSPTEVFRQEAADLLDTLETTLLDLGQKPQDRELVDTAFRALHTIKGSGAMFGFDAVAAFTHDFETAFDLVRQGRVQASRELVDVALAAKDFIRALVEDPGSTDPIIGQAILDELGRLVGTPAPAGATASTSVAAISPGSAEAPASPRGWRIEIRFDPDILKGGTNPLGLLDELHELGPCTVSADLADVPPLDRLDPLRLHIGWTVTLHAPVSRQQIEDVFVFTLDDMKLVLTEFGEEAAAAQAPEAAPVLVAAAFVPPIADPAPPSPVDAGPTETGGGEKVGGRRSEDRTSTVRVEAVRLDDLMDRVGELVIAQARLSQLAGQRSDAGMKSIAEEIERLAARLRDTTMGIRMVPIGSLFGRFRRLVHDLSRDLGKPVDFVTSGEETELDKTMIERLADPLVHLIRNAIDHGVEDPARRAASGKPPTARIELLAEHVGAQVLVTVRDDGGGLDTARIRQKAEEKGLVAAGASPTEAEIHQFLFHPGFSTAQTISALSGRGVGMDVVKRTIEAMRGSIDLATEAGQGSSVALRLPLTLAIIDGLLVRVGQGRYVIPLSAIEECVELPDGDRQGRGRDFLNIRGDLVPFLRLRDLFAADGEPDEHQKVIVTRVDGHRVGLVADQIIGSHQTVIKSLSKLHADVTLFSGATILGDGSAALIIDVRHMAGEVPGDALKEAA